MFEGKKKGLAFLVSDPFFKKYVSVLFVLSCLLVASRYSPLGQFFYNLSAFYCLILTAYLLTRFLGKKSPLKMRIPESKLGKLALFLLVLVFLRLILAFGVLVFYASFVFVVLGFFSWTFVESYSFVAFAWDFSGRLKYLLVGFFVSAAVLFSYVAYLGLKLAQLNQQAQQGAVFTAGWFDALVSVLMFLYAVSTMGQRFSESKLSEKRRSMMIAVMLIMVMGYVLVVGGGPASPQAENQVASQITYYGAKLFFIAVSFVLLPLVRTAKGFRGAVNRLTGL